MTLPTQTEQTPFQLAQAEYHTAAAKFVAALEAEIRRLIVEAFPTATRIVCWSEFNEDGGAILRLAEVHDPDGLVAHTDHDNDRDDDSGEALDGLIDDGADGYLDWLCDLTGDDYVSADPLAFDVTDERIEYAGRVT